MNANAQPEIEIKVNNAPHTYRPFVEGVAAALPGCTRAELWDKSQLPKRPFQSLGKGELKFIARGKYPDDEGQWAVVQPIHQRLIGDIPPEAFAGILRETILAYQ